MPQAHHAAKQTSRRKANITPKAHHAAGTSRRKTHHLPQGKQKPRKSGAFLTDYYFYYLLFLMKSLSFLVSIFQ